MVFQFINIRQVRWEVLKTAAFGLGFQHIPRDLANVNAWKTMFDTYIALVSLHLTIPHLFLFRFLGKSMLRDCVFSFHFCIVNTKSVV